MATTAWRKLTAMIKNMIQDGAKYNFLQLMRILEECWFNDQLSSSQLNKYIQLSSAVEISFPAGDVKKCTIDEQNKLQLQLTFMGLYGVDSPLPHYFLEHNNNCIYNFLNIFNNRLYILFYLAWKKYYPLLQLKKSSPYLQYIKLLSGNILTEKDNQEFAGAGLLGCRVHNSTALAGLISEYLGHTQVQIRQFIPYWISLGSVLRIGTGQISLGDNAFLGNQVVSRSRKIAIQIGPLITEQAIQLFPVNTESQRLNGLIYRYLGPKVLFDVILVITSTITQCLILGYDDLRLGWISWLGEKNKAIYQLKIFT